MERIIKFKNFLLNSLDFYNDSNNIQKTNYISEKLELLDAILASTKGCDNEIDALQNQLELMIKEDK